MCSTPFNSTEAKVLCTTLWIRNESTTKMLRKVTYAEPCIGVENEMNLRSSGKMGNSNLHQKIKITVQWFNMIHEQIVGLCPE
jgi:hypothetical protein